MLYHILGTDMTAITGLQPNTVLQIIAEVGIDMSKFPTVITLPRILVLCLETRLPAGKSSRRKRIV